MMEYFWALLFCNVLVGAQAIPFFGKPDGFLSTCEQLDKYDYPCEAHKVTTDDGYILTHFRIAHGKSNANITNKKVVLVQHGLMGSSSQWLLQEPSLSLPYKLADAGYDVWLMNSRGNEYSRKHRDNWTGRKYWDFSWSDVGKKDIPSTIDYISELTKQEKVFHIGHSQGTTSFYVCLAEKPEYNAKIAAHVSFAPVAILKNTEVLRPIIALEKIGLLNLFRQIFGDFNFIPESWAAKVLFSIICQPSMPTNGICVFLLNDLFGHSENQLNATVLPTMFGHFPAGASFKQNIHFAQLAGSGKFQEYDNGLITNYKLYGTSKPREYNVKNIQAPIYAFYGEKDVLASKIDVEYFLPMLPNLVEKINLGECNHADYMASNTASAKAYARTLEILAKYP